MSKQWVHTICDLKSQHDKLVSNFRVFDSSLKGFISMRIMSKELNVI